MQSDLLAIAIPTYKRPAILNENLRAMLPEIQRLGVPVYISDDSPDDETQAMVTGLRQTYDRIYYTRNTPGLGHDLNFVATVQLPESDYVWYLGDSVVINAGDLEKAYVALAAHRPDFLFVNNENRCADTADYRVTDFRGFLQKFAWHLTLSGATIYSRAAVQSVHARSVAQWRNFPQLGLIFQYALAGERTAYWMGSSGVSSNRNKKSYWSSAVVSTFAVDWVKLISNFSSFYSTAELQDIILSHSLHTGIFSWRNAIRYRLNGALSFKLLKAHQAEIKLASHTSYVVLLSISMLPVALGQRIVQCLKYIKNARI
jgi:abequosyltransferase